MGIEYGIVGGRLSPAAVVVESRTARLARHDVSSHVKRKGPAMARAMNTRACSPLSSGIDIEEDMLRTRASIQQISQANYK